MKKALLVCLILFSCKKAQHNNDTKLSKKDTTLVATQKVVAKEIKFINAPSGLNYRDQPKGKILGKLNNNDEVIIIEHTAIFTEIIDENKPIKGEWVGIRIKKDTVYIFDAFLSTTKNNIYTDVWSKFPLRKMPFVDSTNFDNIIKKNKLSTNEIKQLQLNELYSNYDKYASDYKFYPSYKLNLGNYKSIVVNVFKGDHELEAILIIYNSNDELIKIYQGDHTSPSINALIIAYDEIAESWSRTTSTIKNNCITTIDALYTEPPVIDTLIHHINRFGIINKVNINFKNNLRPNKPIQLHTIYTDTIQFIGYNEDYDYFSLEGKKHNKTISLNYNWNSGEKKYHFKKDDFIILKWKMDSVFIAGDGETLFFSEHAIDAEKIK